MDDAVDVVVTGHTNWAVNCVIDGKVVTGAAATGRLITDIDLTVDRRSRDVVSASVNNRIVTRDVAAAPELTSLIAKYKALSAPLATRVVGTTTAPLLRATNSAGESALGDVIADSQLLATTPAALGGAQIALMNPGGIRADLDAGSTTYEEIFTVQPFGNSLVTMTLTGAALDAVLEQQFDNPVTGQNRILQVSNGFTYTWSASAAKGSKVSALALNGTAIDPATSYRVTVNNFLSTGGDNFTALTRGTNLLGGDLDLDALEKFFTANPSGVAPGPQNRITRMT